ncbi:MAG: adenylosuccinate synthetase, partial [Treponema sp.]|nr:adenylosuccinate synthetase [Treponema sp.]
KELDKKKDSERKKPIGTTGRGIGTTYSQKSERDSIRLADLDWKERLDDLLEDDKKFLEKYSSLLLELKVDIAAKLYEYRNDNILFEGAQGALLDLDSGTYPFVSSGASCSAGAALGSGIGPRAIDKVLGVFKAYQTRVGNGPMPTEFNNTDESELCNYIRNTGNEFGVTTGRPRRCGYLDLVALRYACRVNSIDSLILTHLDIYDAMDTIEACTAYEVDGKLTEDFPASISALEKALPLLKKFGGWKTNLKQFSKYEDFPRNAKTYVKFIEDFTGVPVEIVSVGEDRNQTLVRKKIWE